MTISLRATVVFALLAIHSEAFSSHPRPTRFVLTSSSLLSATKQHDLSVLANIRAAVAATAFSMALLTAPAMSHADGNTKEFKLPPIDLENKNRCVFQGSSMGQANAARDKLYDLRLCKLSGKDATGLDLSGVIMSQTDVSNAKFVDAYFSKGYLHDSNFDGADFTNAIVDRASFSGSTLRGAIFKNTVLTGTSFEGANVEGADFTEAALGDFDIKSLCRNPTLKGTNPTTGEDTRMTVGCKN
jgi:uncharacterized protein YjbI with pentapeptide repeats